MRFDRSLMSLLLDKYENSILSKQGSARHLAIMVKSGDPIFRTYWSDDAYLRRDEILAQLDALQKRDWIEIAFDANREIESVRLNPDRIEEIYRFSDRINPKEERAAMASYLEAYRNATFPLSAFARQAIDLLKQHKSIKSYAEDLDTLKKVVEALDAMLALSEDQYVRNFSKRLFNDSKAFEAIEGKVVKILRDFAEFHHESNEEVLREYHLIRTPTFAYLKGPISFVVRGQALDLKQYNDAFALTSSVVDDLIISDMQAKRIVTVENLTTFVAMPAEHTLCVYLGGFHNTVKRTLLQKLYHHNPHSVFCHFGDIDAGGFLIFEDLVRKTSIRFLPFRMDIETLKQNKENWQPLTDHDRKRLTVIQAPELHAVASFMLENNCKLEQEAIAIKELRT